MVDEDYVFVSTDDDTHNLDSNVDDFGYDEEDFEADTVETTNAVCESLNSSSDTENTQQIAANVDTTTVNVGTPTILHHTCDPAEDVVTDHQSSKLPSAPRSSRQLRKNKAGGSKRKHRR